MSILDLVKVLTASAGDSTIGSPPTLKEVFNNTGTPVSLKNSCKGP